MTRKFLTPVGLPSGASVPATGSAGALFFNTSDELVYVHDGTAWAPVVGDGMPAGGADGQILAKASATDYDTEWIDNYATQIKHEVKLAESISKGQAVYTSGANGTNILVSKASNATEGTSSKTLGLLETGGATNDIVKVVTSGLLAGLNTDGATAGDPVWLGTSGNLIFGLASKPVAPAHMVYLGVVTRVNSSNGEIFVHVQNGFELDELHTVSLEASASIADNEVLAFDSATSLWKNQTAAEANLSVVGHTHAIANVTDLQTTLDAKANLAGASFTGNVSTTGDLTTSGKLYVNASAGDEGGEIFLNKPVSNTSISGGVNIDIYQNKLRFWESGGSARGYYVDITAGGAGAGTSLTGGSTGAMNYAQTEGTKQSAISSVGTTIVSVSITTNGYPVLVSVTGDVENNSAGGWVVLQLYRGATAIGNPVHAESSAGSENVPYGLSVVDAPAAGTYTYALKLNNSAGGTFNFGESDGPVITAIELSGPKGDTGSAGANGTSPNAFTTISTTSGTSPVADSTSDTLTLSAGTGITVTGDSATDTVTIATNAAAANGASTIVLRDASGGFSAGAITAASFSGSGAALTNVPGANVTGTLTSTVLGNSTAYVGTTAVALNRASANQALTGISSIALPGSTSGTITLQPNAAAGTTTLTLPATTGTLALTSQIPTVNDGTLTLAVSGTGLSGSASFTANQSGTSTFTVTSNANSANGASTVVARDASGNFTANAITATTFNKMAITAPATGSTLAIANLKTFTVSNTITLTGTDSTSMRFPSTSANIARTDAAQAFAGTQTFDGNVVLPNGTGTLSVTGPTGSTSLTSVSIETTGYVFSTGSISTDGSFIAGGALQHTTRTSTTTESASGMYASSSGFLSLSRNGTPLIINHYAGSGTVYPVQFYYTGTASGRISMTSGGTPAFTSGSDYRMKENIVPIEDALQRMKNAKAYTFNKIESVDPTMHNQTGFLAHELAEVHPEAVIGEKDAVDENGDPIYQEVMEAKIIPIMAQALKELIEKSEALEARLAALEENSI